MTAPLREKTPEARLLALFARLLEALLHEALTPAAEAVTDAAE